MAKIYENMGSIYEDLEKYDSSKFYFTRALRFYDDAGEAIASIEVINNLGDILRKSGHYMEALAQTREALALAERTNNLYEKGAACRDLGKTYNLLNQNDSAYHYLELSRQATIAIYSQDNNRQTAFLSVLFDIDKKNDEINQLENARHVNRIIAIAVVIVVVLLVILGGLFISRQKLKIMNERRLNDRQRDIYKTQNELIQAELQNKQLEEDKLIQELAVKKKELTSYTLHVIQKNQLLENLRERLEVMVKDERRDQKKQMQDLTRQISMNFNHDQHWNEFREIFEQVHQQFFDDLKGYCEDLTGNDLRLAALIKLNFNSKDISTLLGISQDSLRVTRYRLRKKLNLVQGDSLNSFLQSI